MRRPLEEEVTDNKVTALCGVSESQIAFDLALNASLASGLNARPAARNPVWSMRRLNRQFAMEARPLVFQQGKVNGGWLGRSCR